MTFDHDSLNLLQEALCSLEQGFSGLPEFNPTASEDQGPIRQVLLEAAGRLRGDAPYQHPLYIGQMLKPPHAMARLAYALAMFLNPNNHALDGGRGSSAMEKEAVAQIARMFGLETYLGHLCGGGTMANFEALWIARQVRPGEAIAASTQAHYTHERLSAVLDVPFRKVPVDPRGRMDVAALEDALKDGPVGTVVATLGSTAAGAVDPLDEILDLRARHGFRLHVDTAYGGYFTLTSNLSAEARRAFDRIRDADSVVVDPHKHGLQPYGCGCVLFRDPTVGHFYSHDSPYTYFSSEELHLGEISLECSRPGASAVALWSTMRLFPLESGGRFAAGLESGREAAWALHVAMSRDPRFAPLFEPELDIVVWAVRANSASESSSLARQIFAAAADSDLHLALASFPRVMVDTTGAIQTWDVDSVACLRACCMKPEHHDWMPEILKRFGLAADRVLGKFGPEKMG